MTQGTRQSGRRLLIDALIAIVVLVLGLTGSFSGEPEAEFFTRETDLVGYLLIVLMSVPLAFRRIYPIPVLAVVTGAWIVDRGLDYPISMAMIGLVFAFHAVGSELPRRQSLLAGGIGVAAVTLWTLSGVLNFDYLPFSNVILMFVATAAPLYLGREVHERRRRMEELERRAERAEMEREEGARQAVAEERSRIARELHDVVAHQMTVMTIQAEGASRVAQGADPRVVDALETIKETGHSALAEMRRVVGLLRARDERDPELAPLPRLDDVDRLVGNIEAAGVPVDLEVSGEHRPLPEGVELSAYRIVQESLTNTVRHAGPGASARVALRFEEEHLDVLVEDDGRGAAVDESFGGHGLVGMKERVAVLGGDLEAGPKPEGGFRVHARIPAES